MIDDLKIKNAILEEKLLFKMKQATYYKKKYLEDHRKLKEVREKLIDLFGTDDKDINNILEILDKENKND